MSSIGHHRQGNVRSAITLVERRLLVGIPDAEAELLVAAAHLAANGLGVAFPRPFVRIEAEARLHVLGPVDAVVIVLPRPHIWQVNVLNPIRLFEHDD